MSLNNKNIIDLKVVQNTEKSPNFSTGLYHWMMFLINFYNRVKKDLKIDFDSFMILQLVVSDYLYKTNKEGTKNYKELEESFKNYPDFSDKKGYTKGSWKYDRKQNTLIYKIKERYSPPKEENLKGATKLAKAFEGEVIKN